MGATYCPRVRERVSRPGGGGGDLNNVIYNFVESCGLFNDTSSIEVGHPRAVIRSAGFVFRL